LHREDTEGTEKVKVNGENRRLNVMGCDVWEVVARKKTSSIHQRGNLQKGKAEAKGKACTGRTPRTQRKARQSQRLTLAKVK